MPDIWVSKGEAQEFPFATICADDTSWCNASTPRDREKHEQYLRDCGSTPILRVNITRLK